MSPKDILPRTLRIKDNCSIDGLVRGKRLGPGLYVKGKNIDDETFERLNSGEFAHAVEQYVPKQEKLAVISDLPREPEGITRQREKQRIAEAEFKSRWPGGRPTQYSVD